MYLDSTQNNVFESYIVQCRPRVEVCILINIQCLLLMKTHWRQLVKYLQTRKGAKYWALLYCSSYNVFDVITFWTFFVCVTCNNSVIILFWCFWMDIYHEIIYGITRNYEGCCPPWIIKKLKFKLNKKCFFNKLKFDLRIFHVWRFSKRVLLNAFILSHMLYEDNIIWLNVIFLKAFLYDFLNIMGCH
jgi:hypothetical protein